MALASAVPVFLCRLGAMNWPPASMIFSSRGGAANTGASMFSMRASCCLRNLVVSTRPVSSKASTENDIAHHCNGLSVDALDHRLDSADPLAGELWQATTRRILEHRPKAVFAIR